jgi:hypothetical protein
MTGIMPTRMTIKRTTGQQGGGWQRKAAAIITTAVVALGPGADRLAVDQRICRTAQPIVLNNAGATAVVTTQKMGGREGRMPMAQNIAGGCDENVSN